MMLDMKDLDEIRSLIRGELKPIKRELSNLQKLIRPFSSSSTIRMSIDSSAETKKEITYHPDTSDKEKMYIQMRPIVDTDNAKNAILYFRSKQLEQNSIKYLASLGYKIAKTEEDGSEHTVNVDDIKKQMNVEYGAMVKDSLGVIDRADSIPPEVMKDIEDLAGKEKEDLAKELVDIDDDMDPEFVDILGEVTNSIKRLKAYSDKTGEPAISAKQLQTPEFQYITHLLDLHHKNDLTDIRPNY